MAKKLKTPPAKVLSTCEMIERFPDEQSAIDSREGATQLCRLPTLFYPVSLLTRRKLSFAEAILMVCCRTL